MKVLVKAAIVFRSPTGEEIRREEVNETRDVDPATPVPLFHLGVFIGQVRLDEAVEWSKWHTDYSFMLPLEDEGKTVPPGES